MALDTGGNQAVDFVWGNTPLQPNTDRATSLLTNYSIAQALVYDTYQGFALYDPTGLSVGDTVTVSGYSDDYGLLALNGTYTIAQLLTGATTLALTTTPFVAEGGPSQSETATLVKDASGNVGGGNGDYGWSTTTKKRSLQLDPALDSHNIVTEFWNNFPGYTPNAGFVSQSVWEGTVATTYTASVQRDSTYGNSDEYGEVSNGYILQFTGGALSQEDSDSLYTAVTTSALIGERVPSFSVIDYYENTVTVPAGHIVGADFDIMTGLYGNKEFFIRVAVDNFENVSGLQFGWLSADQVVTLGLGAPKEVVANAVVGTDIGTVVFSLDPYLDLANIVIYGPDYNYNNMSSAMKALVGQNLSGGYVGMGILGENSNNYGPYDLQTNFFALSGQAVDIVTDPYQNPQGIRLHLADFDGGSGGGNPLYGESAGDTLVIIK